LAQRNGLSFAALGKTLDGNTCELPRTGFQLRPEFFDVAWSAV